MTKETEEIFYGATFDDFLFRPQHSILLSRREADLSMPLTRNIRISNPIVGANMDTVTREKMMQTLALEGCFGFLDRNCPIEEQANRVKYVKRQHTSVIDNPAVLSRKNTISDAKKFLKKFNVSSLLIEDKPGNRILVGILSHRDILAAGEKDSPVEEFMTPLKKLITGKHDIGVKEAEALMLSHRIEKLPLVDKGKIAGLITMRDLRMVKQKPYSAKDKKGRLMVGAAVGATGDYMERAGALISVGANCILMDVAHADSEVMKKAVKNFKTGFKGTDLICGNIATGDGARFLAEMGADGIKVGIGPGRGCRTRLETSAGVPQLQAIRETFLATQGKIPIIADGGIKSDKDIFLAICAGASTVMLGSMLSGTEEAPGVLIEDPATRQKFKIYRGMTSPEAVIDGSISEDLDDAPETPAEGQSVKTPFVGTVMDVIKRIRGHLQSAVSYAGENNLYSAHKKVTAEPERFLIRLSEAGRIESFVR